MPTGHMKISFSPSAVLSIRIHSILRHLGFLDSDPQKYDDQLIQIQMAKFQPKHRE